MSTPRCSDRHGRPVTLGTKVRVIALPSGLLDDLGDDELLDELPDDERVDLLSMLGNVFEVMAVDERGFAFIEKTWHEAPDTSIGHGLYLAPDEMEVAA